MSPARGRGRKNTASSGASSSWSDYPDEELARYAADDEGAFVILYQRHVSGVYSYARWKVGPADAEDITAETFMRALRGMRQFREDSSFRTWLFGIARRTVAQHLGSKQETISESELDIVSEEDLQELHLVTETGEHLRDMVSRLRKPYREVIELRYWVGMSVREIAELLSKKETAVKVTMYRAIRQLRSMWKDGD